MKGERRRAQRARPRAEGERRRALALGVGAALLYVGAAIQLLGTGRPVLPVFDGQAPPIPYRWVDPPPDLPAANQPPLEGSRTFPFEEATGGFSVVTEDGQAQVSGQAGAIPTPPGEDAFAVEIAPLDPDGIAPPPGGLRFDGNAYEVRGEYRPSGEPVELDGVVSVVLRYPTHATTILRWTGSGWTRLQATPVPATLQVFADSPAFGTFVAAAQAEAEEDGGFPWLAVGAAAGAVALAAGGWTWRRRARRKRRRKPPAKKTRAAVTGRAPRPRKRGRGGRSRRK